MRWLFPPDVHAAAGFGRPRGVRQRRQPKTPMKTRIPRKGLQSEFPNHARSVAYILSIGRDEIMRLWPSLFRGFFNPPSLGQARMMVIDKVIGGFGVEAVHADDGGLFGQGSVALEYVNMGDPYVPTILRWRGGRYEVGCWGDAVERLERRGVAVK